MSPRQRKFLCIAALFLVAGVSVAVLRPLLAGKATNCACADLATGLPLDNSPAHQQATGHRGAP